MANSKKKGSANPNLLRGLFGVVFMAIVAAVFLFQEIQSRPASPLPRMATPAGEVTRSLPPAQRPTQSDVLRVYFSDPADREQGRALEAALVEAIGGAQRTIDLAIYNISLPSATDALLAARRRGVLVRMVMESDAMGSQSVERLSDAGIEIIGDQRQNLMHHKFMVVDNQEVWTGSLNFTATGLYNDYNNMLRIRSQRAAQNYTVEFNEMFVEGLFGPQSRANTPYPEVTVDGVPLEMYFSPEDGVTDQIIAELRAARERIDFLAYSFTSDPIAQAMTDRAVLGVKIRGVFDESQYRSNTGTEYDYFKQGGYDVRLDGASGLMHHKVIVIDAKTVITGSFNFSANAERYNDENIVIIHDAGLAGQYLQAFETIYAGGK